MEAGMEAAVVQYPATSMKLTWSWSYLLKTVIISTCLLQVMLAPGVGAGGDGEDTGGILPDSSPNGNLTTNSSATSKSLSQKLNTTTTTISVSIVTPMSDHSVTTTYSDNGAYRSSSTTIPEPVEAHGQETQSSTTRVTEPPLPLSPTAIITTSKPDLVTQPPGSQDKSGLTTPEATSSNTSQAVPSQGEDTTSPLDISDMDISDNSTHNRTIMASPASFFNLHSRVTYAVIAGFVAIVVIVIGKFTCKRIEKRMNRTGDEEYANILEDAFSMATEENVWDARWSNGRDQHSSQGVPEEADRIKVIHVGEDSSLRSEHQRVTLHVPGSRPYGATESLMV